MQVVTCFHGCPAAAVGQTPPGCHADLAASQQRSRPQRAPPMGFEEKPKGEHQFGGGGGSQKLTDPNSPNQGCPSGGFFGDLLSGPKGRTPLFSSKSASTRPESQVPSAPPQIPMAFPAVASGGEGGFPPPPGGFFGEESRGRGGGCVILFCVPWSPLLAFSAPQPRLGRSRIWSAGIGLILLVRNACACVVRASPSEPVICRPGGDGGILACTQKQAWASHCDADDAGSGACCALTS